METQESIAGAPMAAIDGRTAAHMLRTLAAQPGCSSDGLLILADRLDEAQPHATPVEQPKVATISRLARDMAPVWATGSAA